MSQQAAPKSDENRGLGLGGKVIVYAVLAGAAAVYISGQPEWGAWTRWGTPAAWAAAVLVSVVLATLLASRRRRSAIRRLADAMRPVLGTEWSPDTDMRARRVRRSVTQRATIHYPATHPDWDQSWRATVERTALARMGETRKVLRLRPRFPFATLEEHRYKLATAWDTRRQTVKLRTIRNRTVESPEARAQEETVKRMQKVLIPSLGAGLTITVHEWQ